VFFAKQQNFVERLGVMAPAPVPPLGPYIMLNNANCFDRHVTRVSMWWSLYLAVWCDVMHGRLNAYMHGRCGRCVVCRPTDSPQFTPFQAIITEIVHPCFHAAVTCEIKLSHYYWNLRRRPSEIILFHRVKTCIKIISKNISQARRSSRTFSGICSFQCRCINNYEVIS